MTGQHDTIAPRPGTGEPVLEVDAVTKTFRLHHGRANSLKERLTARRSTRYDDFTALHDVSFSVAEGEVFGVIGHNGSGKSTLLKCMAGILQPTSGEVRVHTRMSALLELGAGFHPELTGRDNVFLNAAILGMTRREIAGRFDEIVEFSGLADFIDTPVKTYSSGMYVRLAFAVAINVDPRLLLIDEILAVGDITFQQKCLEKFSEFREQGRTIVIVTHDLETVRNLCDRAVLLDHGRVAGTGDPRRLVDDYTEGMLVDSPAHADGSTRHGTGELRVEQVALEVDGVETDRCRTGDSVRFVLRARADEPVERPVFSIRLESLDGVTVTQPSTRDVDLVPDRVHGEVDVTIELDDLPLLPGPYVVHTEISDHGRGQVYDHLHRALRFDVTTGDVNESGAIVTLRPRWRIDRA